ncbi:MAG TPA: hypothetical protein VGN57_22845 [Pirellulaceae bacterium]|jgi:hypothetical protein|nr:hypothetical protein [Pirellulaceae bacterium]
MLKSFALAAALTLCCHAASALAAEKVHRDAKELRSSGEYRDALHVDFTDEEYPSKYRDLLRALPNLQTLAVGGPRFTDWYLKDLAKIESLRAIVLDSTDVTDAAIEEVRKLRPELSIYRSQRRATEEIRKLALEAIVVTRTNEGYPELAELLGKRHFEEATEVSFRKLPDDETGPFDQILNEELAPLRMLPTVEELDLKWTRINDGGLHYLKNLKQLRSLRLPLDEISEEGRKLLRERQGLEELEGTENGKHVLRIIK